MARVPDLMRICKKHDLVMITVADPARYRLEADSEALIGENVHTRHDAVNERTA
jgi:hypothetical protein